MNNFILITGNPIKGFKFTGLFNTEMDVVNYAEKEMGLDIDWYIGYLSAPVPPNDQKIIEYISSSLENKEIRHKDGDLTNYDISNLELIDKKPYELVSQDTLDEIRSQLDREDNKYNEFEEDIPF